MSWSEVEKQALAHRDWMASVKVVSALRRYRELVKALLVKRYRDGEVDGATLSAFTTDVRDIEEEGWKE